MAQMTSAPADRSRRIGRLLRIFDEYLIWIFVAASIALMSAVSSRFFTAQNLLNLVLSSSVLGILVLACVLPLLLGYFDLSVESTLTLSALVGGMMVTAGAANPLLSMAVVLALGTAAGLVNGLFIVYLRVNPFIQTLSMNIILRGLVFTISGGQPYTAFPEAYRLPGAGLVLGIPLPIILLLVLYALFGILLQKTSWGRNMYAAGQNRAAAYIAGVSMPRLTIQAFVLSGLLAGLGGLVVSTRMNAIDYNVGLGMSFEIFAAAVIGGVALSGGRGRLVGAIGGVIFLSVISSVLTWMNISIYWVETTRGFVILFAVLLDASKNRLREAFARR